MRLAHRSQNNSLRGVPMLDILDFIMEAFGYEQSLVERSTLD
ncbi:MULTISPECIES: hypothetical protein [unclassified Vibrio]|uniref:Uncharacterized protein n=1 Tax=Vibrio sp. HB236076 TaxID=3232307 RepID=A0AB39HBZ4_9VIBR|nr:hypothetical protein [Vibrio sp. HB161653]MDP5255793.1 hypothetical protein [Vibrio sp. HB161653]